MKKRLWIWITTITVMLVVIAFTLLLPGQEGLLMGKAKSMTLLRTTITVDTKAEISEYSGVIYSITMSILYIIRNWSPK
jgi:hypothetical protein